MQISHFRVENYSSNKTCVELVGGVNWENSVEISGILYHICRDSGYKLSS